MDLCLESIAVNWSVRLADWTLPSGLQTDFAVTWLGLYQTLSGVRAVSCRGTCVDLGLVILLPPASQQFFCIS